MFGPSQKWPKGMGSFWKVRVTLGETPHRQYGPSQKWETLKYEVVNFYRLGNCIWWWMGGLSQLLWRKAGDLWRPVCPLTVSLRLAWSLWLCRLGASVVQWARGEAQGPLGANLWPLWTQLVLTNFCHILNSCRFVKDCALFLSLLHWQSHHSKERKYGGKNHVLALKCSPGNDICPFCSNCPGPRKSYDHVQPHGSGSRHVQACCYCTKLGSSRWTPGKASLLIPDFSEGNCSIHFRAAKDPNSPVALRQGFLKATLG